MKTLKIRVKLILNCPRAHAITYTNSVTQIYNLAFGELCSYIDYYSLGFKKYSLIAFVFVFFNKTLLREGKKGNIHGPCEGRTHDLGVISTTLYQLS